MACIFASAQTKIACEYSKATDKFVAPLAWQNTLGTARANAMCASASEQIQTRTEPAQQRIVPATQELVPARQVFAMQDGDRASDVLRKWATAQGYALVWDAPVQSDLYLSNGSIDAVDFTDAVSKLITALNAKVAIKRKANGPESQFAFQVEALAYSNKVIAVTVKQ